MVKTDEKKIEKISDLPGIGSTTLQKLEEAGFTDMMSIATASASILMDATGMLKATAAKAILAARSAVDLGFQTGEEFLETRLTTGKITTGSAELNNLAAESKPGDLVNSLVSLVHQNRKLVFNSR